MNPNFNENDRMKLEIGHLKAQLEESQKKIQEFENIILFQKKENKKLVTKLQKMFKKEGEIIFDKNNNHSLEKPCTMHIQSFGNYFSPQNC